MKVLHSTMKRDALITFAYFWLWCTLKVDAKQLSGCKAPQNAPRNESYTRVCLITDLLNRTYSLSTTGPVAAALDRANVAHALEDILQFVQREHQRVKNLATKRRSQFEFLIERACNVPILPYNGGTLNGVRRTISSYGWGLITTRCITRLITEVAETPIAAMKKFQHALEQASPSILDKLALKWPNPSIVNLYKYETTSNKCELWHYTAFRVKGQWGLHAVVTNEAITKWLPDRQRIYIAETIRVDESGRIVVIPKLIRRRPAKPWIKGEPFITEFEPGSTTHIATWGGIPSGNTFTAPYSISDNPAIEGALAKGFATLDQVEDAITVSGIALLIVPVFFTVVPVSAFYDVGRVGALMYILFTDVFTVLPLFVKGIELISYSTRPFEAARTQVYSGVGNNETAVIETWYADCKAKNRIQTCGLLFLSFALFFMILGIAIELATKQYMDMKYLSRRRKRKYSLYTVFCEHCQLPTTPEEYYVKVVCPTYLHDA